jgi:hypothetical protein
VAALSQRLAGLEGIGPLLMPAAGGVAAGVTTVPGQVGQGPEGVTGSTARVGAAHVADSSSSNSRGRSPCVRADAVGMVGTGEQGSKASGVSEVSCAPPSVGAGTSVAAGGVVQVHPGVPLQPGKQAPVLTVIVGRGLHSSEGEASVPRAVEGWLLEHRYRYRSGVGVLHVHVKRTGVRAG